MSCVWFWIVPPRPKASLCSDINNMSSMQAGLQGLLNVTADSLAEYCGLTGDQQENSVFFERQVCILLAISSSSPFLICALAWFAPKESIPKRDQFVCLAARVAPFCQIPWLNYELLPCFCQWILRQVSPSPRGRLRCARRGVQHTHENAQYCCLPVNFLRLLFSLLSLHSFQALLFQVS